MTYLTRLWNSFGLTARYSNKLLDFFIHFLSVGGYFSLLVCPRIIFGDVKFFFWFQCFLLIIYPCYLLHLFLLSLNFVNLFFFVLFSMFFDIFADLESWIERKTNSLAVHRLQTNLLLTTSSVLDFLRFLSNLTIRFYGHPNMYDA